MKKKPTSLSQQVKDAQKVFNKFPKEKQEYLLQDLAVIRYNARLPKTISVDRDWQ